MRDTETIIRLNGNYELARRRYRKAAVNDPTEDVIEDDPVDAADDPTDVTPALPAPRPARRRPIGNGCRPCAVVIRTHSAPTAWCKRVAPVWSYAPTTTVKEHAERAGRERLQADIERLKREHAEQAKRLEVSERARMQLANTPKPPSFWVRQIRRIENVPACDWWVYGPVIWFLGWVVQLNVRLWWESL